MQDTSLLHRPLVKRVVGRVLRILFSLIIYQLYLSKIKQINTRNTTKTKQIAQTYQENLDYIGMKTKQISKIAQTTKKI